MDDLISRQAAIDAVYERIRQIGYEHNALVLSIRQAIRDLPSAEPEIIRCRDCRYWQDNNGGYPHTDCKWISDETPDPDDYCSGGSRKKDE